MCRDCALAYQRFISKPGIVSGLDVVDWVLKRVDHGVRWWPMHEVPTTPDRKILIRTKPKEFCVASYREGHWWNDETGRQIKRAWGWMFISDELRLPKPEDAHDVIVSPSTI